MSFKSSTLPVIEKQEESGLAQFMHDFNRMKIKINNLLTKQRESEEKISSLEGMVDRLFAENVKVNADMKILRDEHTEVLHSIFAYERKNTQLNQEN